ncbi:MAG: chemotaxis protein CheW [Burkholderiaceae bacterium]
MQDTTSSAFRSASRTEVGARLSKQEYLSFKLGAEEYGIDILKVQEIRGYEPPTRLANVPDYIKGVVNLRGTIVPIVDLRIKFRLDSAEYNDFTVVIILTVSGRVLGVVVDGVSDVTSLGADQIKPKPEFSAAVDADHIVGLGTVDDRMLILIDIERLVSSGELALAESTGSLQ